MSEAKVVFPLTPTTRVMVAGAGGLVGRAAVAELSRRGVVFLLTPSSRDLDLRDRDAVFSYLSENTPEVVIDAAARVGGIHANNTYPAEFLSENLQIQVNLMDAAAASDVKRFVFLGSSCIYPTFAPQPIRESSLLTGELEPTNSAYAVAKIAGIEQVKSHRRQYGRAWISAMPTNIYGPGDNFHPENSHVVPALIRRIHEARSNLQPEVVIWGSGKPLREFLYSEDLGRAVVFLLEHYDSDEIINVGSGQEVSIRQLAEIIAKVVGYQGELKFDPSKPDGTPRKLLDNSKIESMGWRASTSLKVGLTAAYQWFVANEDHLRSR